MNCYNFGLIVNFRNVEGTKPARIADSVQVFGLFSQHVVVAVYMVTRILAISAIFNLIVWNGLTIKFKWERLEDFGILPYLFKFVNKS